MTQQKMTNGICGLSCVEDCLNHGITLRNDRLEMEEAAKQWSLEDGKVYSVNDIVCHGCWETDDRVSSSARECKVRSCAKRRGLESCDACGENPCLTIKELLSKYSQEAIDMMESLNQPS